VLVVNTLVKWESEGIREIGYEVQGGREGTRELGYEVQRGNVVERILWLDGSKDLAYVIDINANRFPYLRAISEYEDALERDMAVILDTDPFIKAVDETLLTKRAKEIRDKAWEAISPIIVLEPEIYDSRERSKYIKSVAEKHQMTEKTIVKYLKRYWIRGKTINALIPDFYRCGGRGKEKANTGVKRGRPRKHSDIVGVGVNIDEEIKRIFQIAINKFYYSSAKYSLALTYELMRKEYFNEGYRIENGIEVPILKPSSEVPTFGQFRYWFNKERDIKHEISSRYSPKKYQQEYRPVLGSSSVDSIGPGSLYQIDATIADVYLVSRFNRAHIIGRPVVYVVQDCFSRIITGIYVGLEGPSWIGASMAIANSASDKVKFCREYEVEIKGEEWPVHHLPQAILADRGEMLSDNAESLIMNLGITIKNTPPYRADWKPLIERYFKLTNERTKAFLPGVINPDFRERGGRDYRLDAKLDLQQFTKIIIKCALYHNNHYRMDNYNKDEMMVSDEVEPIPREIWNWGLTNKMGKLRQVDEEVVKLNLMPSDNGVVTAKGIRFKGLYYSSKTCMKEQWFVKARSRGSWQIPICYDPRRVDYIYIKKSATEFEKCFLLEYQTAFKDKYLEEVEYLNEWERVQKVKSSDVSMQAKSDLMTEIQNVVNNAKKETDSKLFLSNESDTQRKKNIRENRQVEKEINREMEVFELDKREMQGKAEIIPFGKVEEELPDNPLELLRKKQREHLRNRDKGY
jgi:hypothetical protein